VPGHGDVVRFFGVDVTGHRVRPGAGSAAHGPEFTSTTPAAQLCGVAQCGEQRRLTVDVGQSLRADVTSRQREEAAGVYLATMADEDEAVAGADLQGRPAGPVGSVSEAEIVDSLSQPPVQRSETEGLDGGYATAGDGRVDLHLQGQLGGVAPGAGGCASVRKSSPDSGSHRLPDNAALDLAAWRSGTGPTALFAWH
jgi:hypothetical protein